MIRIIKSVYSSIKKAVYGDPEIRKLAKKHKRLFHFIRERFVRRDEFGLHFTVGITATVIFVVLFFSILQDYLRFDPLVQADLRILNLLQIFRTPKFINVMLFITNLGKWEIVFLGAFFVAFLLVLKRLYRYAIALIALISVSEVVIWILKHLIERPRPPLVNAVLPSDGFSFPSGHSFMGVVFYGFLVYLALKLSRGKLIKVLAVIGGLAVIFLIGFSRIYLGVHWPSDVLASYAAGGALLAAVITIIEARITAAKEKKEVKQTATTSRFFIALLGVFLFMLWTMYAGYFFTTHTIIKQSGITEEYTAIDSANIGEDIFRYLPRASEDITGGAMEPIDIIVVGGYDALAKSFNDAGWLLTDPITFQSSWRMAKAAFSGAKYPQAPGIPSFWNTRTNDFAFEKTVDGSARERSHIHFWKTSFTIDNKPIWVATAHFDKTLKGGILSKFFPIHTIDPAIDKERDKVKNELMATGDVESIEKIKIVEPTLGSNQAGDQFFTDGYAYVIFLKS